jgi:acyl-CoA dehydrogenase
MYLLNPNKHTRSYKDEESRQIMLKTLEHFEQRGKKKLKEDDHERAWYADFLEFVKKEEIFAKLLTPTGYGDDDSRWDTWRNCEFNEILGFYGLAYWYTWQVSILGLGPIWMSKNEEAKQKAAQALKDGGIFAFGLSEKEHGADVYQSDMLLTPQGDGTYLANGGKYYIGNGNKAAMVSVFGKLTDTGDYVFFTVDSQHEKYELVKNVVNSQNYVSEFVLHDYPITEADILSKGRDAWDSALNTVNVGKYNLGWASIGMCTHAMYEAVKHAANRNLYGQYVTDFPHVKQMFTEAYCRLVTMKMVALRTSDYMRTASPDDRRYLLFDPVVKMKVTTQGVDVVTLMWDIMAAKGFEKDNFFEMAARDIQALPRLEGTVHVNIWLIVKFMMNYFMNHKEYPEIGKQDQVANDDFLFDQGVTKGLGKTQFDDFSKIYDAFDLPNVNVFKKQIEAFKGFMMGSPPSPEQQKNPEFMLSLGELFTLIVYGQLFLENVKHYDIENDLIEQVFDFIIRDFSGYAVALQGKSCVTEAQADNALKMISRPVIDEKRFMNIWENQVYPLKDEYEMKE